MKKLMLVSMVLLLTIVAYGGGTSDGTAEERGISLGVIIDTGPTSQKTWNMFQVAILEMASQLRAGDKITVYTAHPGKPRLRIVRVVGPDGKYNPSDIVRETMSFSRELLSGANLSRAVELVFEDFYREADDYQHCLVVLSKGKINSGNVDQIKRLVVNFKNNDWPVRFVCEQAQASRGVLVTANNQQLDLRMLDKPELTKWISDARKLDASKASAINDTSKHTEIVVENTEPVQNSEKGKAATTDDGIVKVEIVNRPQIPIGTLRTNAPELPDVENETAKLDEEAGISNDRKSSPQPTGKRPLWSIVLLGTVLVVFLWYCLKNLIFAGSRGQQSGDQLDTQEDLQQRLISVVGSQQQDMGDIATLGEIVIGNGMGATIFIDNDNVEERHVRIFKSGKKMKIKNLAASPILVDGAQLDRKQKTDLIFPADIELASGVVVNLYTEDVNILEDESGDNNEE